MKMKIIIKKINKTFLEFISCVISGIFFFGFLFLLAYPNLSVNNVEKKDKFSYITKEEQIEDKEVCVNTTEMIFLGEFKVTAYCSCDKCCGYWANIRPVNENGKEIVIGAKGDILQQGVSVAVDPTVIPLDTKLYIDGVKYIAQDCGSAIKGNRIDVYFDNHKDALDFGVKYACVEVEINK